MLAAFTFRPVIYRGLSGELEEKVQILLYTIENTVAVSLHIRRGDYLENSEVFGGSCTQEYYKKAVQLVKERYPDAAFLYLIMTRSGLCGGCPRAFRIRW